MDIHYTKGKIAKALWELALDPGNIRARVPKACAELMVASYRDGFEDEFGRIDRILTRVIQGDWNDVSDNELQEIALIIWRLHERINL